MFGLNRFGDGISIARVLAFMDAHGVSIPDLSRRSIVATGTNGKGSTARFLAGALEAAGLRVGVFTSPHLFDVRERIAIGETMIPREALDRHAKTVIAFNDTLPTGGKMGAFELLFFAAVLWFREEAPDVIVWEAGIGGRYDAVRAVGAKLSMLTSIELEHTEILGQTEELIACDKVDALAPGGTLVISPSVPRRLLPLIDSYARLSSRSCSLADENRSIGPVVNTADGARFELSSGATRQAVHLKLIGAHQAQNALTALRTAELWLGDRLTADLQKRMIDALGQVRWAGRLELVSRSPDLWVDVAHTPGAVEQVASALLEFLPRDKALVVFGAAASKQAARMAAAAAARFDDMILTCPYDASADVGELASVVSRHTRRVTIERDVTAAARLARERATAEGKSVIALGGTHLAAKIQRAWAGGNPDELEFL